MAEIGWNDGASVTLRGIYDAPYDRFRNFSPLPNEVGPIVTSLGTGRSSQWRYRREHRVSLELPYISGRVYNGESGVLRAQRLIRYLIAGGAVDLSVQDSVGTATVVCWLAEGTTPTLTFEDRSAGLYTFAATFANTSTPFVAVYGGVQP